jgi:insulysin
MLESADEAQPETPTGDDRLYHHLKLPNGMEVLLVSDPNTDDASVSMDVRVGWYSDSKEIPGRAHLVEHLVLYPLNKVG